MEQEVGTRAVTMNDATLPRRGHVNDGNIFNLKSRIYRHSTVSGQLT